MKQKVSISMLSIGFILAGILSIQSCSVSRLADKDRDYSIRSTLAYLASDQLEGRLPGTSGDSLARFYIRQEMLRNGINLLFREGFQEIPFTRSRYMGENTCMIYKRRAFIQGQDMALFPFSSSDTVSAQIVFAGYGITQTGDSISWNDYSGIDARHKWIMVLPGFPPVEGQAHTYAKYWENLDKAMLARDNGAAGVLFISGKSNDGEEPLISFDTLVAPVGIPVFHIRRAIADSLLHGKDITVSRLESIMNETNKPYSFALEDSLYALSDIRQRKGITYNIAGYREGQDPVLKHECVIIGAHYDHLGTGGRNTSSRRPDTIAVHNGADDNASGVSLMLNLAEQMNRGTIRFRRSIIFAAFGAEEIGLLGSRQFVSYPPVDLQKIVAMINLDMVGRLDTSRGLQVSGTGTSLEADSLVRMANREAGLALRTSAEGFGPSDHASFYGRNIPVFFLTTGAHEDYHTPFDDVNRINFEGLKQVSGFTLKLVESVANHPEKLHFREAGPKTGTPVARRFRVTLGFMPGFDDNVDGVRVEFVTKGKPADLGGIKNGDIITAVKGLPVHSLQDYMYRLSKLSPGETISVEIMRNGQKKVLLIQL